MRICAAIILGWATLFGWALWMPALIPACSHFNSLIHFLAGLFSVFTLGLLCSTMRGFRECGRLFRVLFLFFGAMAMEAGWEIFEYGAVAASLLDHHGCMSLYKDTMKDIIMNTLGGAVAVCFWELLRDGEG